MRVPLASLALSLAACGSSAADPNTCPLVGDPARFEPLAGLAQAQAFAGPGASLLQIEAYHVRSDGTQDLAASFHPYTVYRFKLPAPPPSNVPMGAPGAPSDRIEIRAEDPGSVAVVQSGASTYQIVNRGLRRQEDTSHDDLAPAAPPACTSAALWQAAMAAGAPAQAVASIDYAATGYELSITSTPYFYRFGLDCRIAGPPPVPAAPVPVAPPTNPLAP